ncbi:GIY-YIG nuclease family protein [Candidatus Halobeggiatoa sp. HSG11]|nr:GIY-YIG nuclease family protein [Candidatus Halobeggiatoa sp. HSG11]
MQEYFIYILKLEENSWYIGTTKELMKRFSTHASKSPHSLLDNKVDGSIYKKGLTGIRKVTHIHAVFVTKCSEKILTEIEDTVTAAMGNKYGYDHVRGGTWHPLWNVNSECKQAIRHCEKYTKKDIRSCYNLMEINVREVLDELPFHLTARNT